MPGNGVWAGLLDFESGSTSGVGMQSFSVRLGNHLNPQEDGGVSAHGTAARRPALAAAECAYQPRGEEAKNG